MNSSVYKAVSEFEKRLKEAFPEALIEVVEPLEDEDALLEVFWKKTDMETIRQIAAIQIEVEEKYDVGLAFTIKKRSEQAVA